MVPKSQLSYTQDKIMFKFTFLQLQIETFLIYCMVYGLCLGFQLENNAFILNKIAS